MYKEIKFSDKKELANHLMNVGPVYAGKEKCRLSYQENRPGSPFVCMTNEGEPESMHGLWSLNLYKYYIKQDKTKSILQKDILCEVCNGLDNRRKRYSDGDGNFFASSGDSASQTESTKWINYRVTENPTRPWFGGESPIPEGCKYRIRINGRWVSGMAIPEQDGWGHENFITAYQILGEIDE